MSENVQNSAYREGYPEGLEKAESELVRISRQGRLETATPGPVEGGEVATAGCIGIGLSGGGIRSATFCLGIFQGLARLKLLRQVDFLSTVSGGGYFGSFYTQLLLRKEVERFSEVEDALAPGSGGGGNPALGGNVLKWLRENGRYLAPRGSGDLLLAGAVLLRNWLVVQVVLGVFFLLVFLSAQALRLQVETASWQLDLDGWFRQLGFLKAQGRELLLTLPGKMKVWISPYVLVPEALFLLWAVPCGWAYWLVGRRSRPGEIFKHPLAGVVLVSAAAVAILHWGAPACQPAAQGVIAVTAITLLIALLNWLLPLAIRSYQQRLGGRPPITGQHRQSYLDELTRNLASSELEAGLVLTALSLAFVIIDSLGQTLYLVLRAPGASLGSWGAGLIALIAALSPFASRIMLTLGGANGGKRPKGVSKAVAALAALLVIGTLLTAYSIAANAIAWNLQAPAYAPGQVTAQGAFRLSSAEVVVDESQPNHWRVAAEKAPPPSYAARREPLVVGVAWLIAAALSWLFGQSWPFLNRSTQLPLYSARLIRAYLGASNPKRFEDTAAAAVTRVIEGDDAEMHYYWPWPFPDREPAEPLPAQNSPGWIYRNGAPLHLINITINETVDGKSQVQQQDRKGTGLALGPAGLSAGVRHHAVLAGGSLKTFPEQGFQVFDYGEGRAFSAERLPIGQWLSISGAAFSTGIGARTNLALSLLTGISNIRLGYWWDSGVPPTARKDRQKRGPGRWLGDLFCRLFPVQSFLLDEYTAHFHGTTRRQWYLSDGGHFENMGGYELIRRRLRLIIIIDAEADPDYTFEGLAGLVRKARTDFGAEITFLGQERLDEVLGGEGHCFSSLENLRRGKWVEENSPVLNKNEARRRLIDPVDYGRFSLAHAAMATVSYDGSNNPQSCLVYVKPTLLGNEPLDVLQYHVQHPTFPQEATIDQFFDEAQWESYRRLGELIAGRVFGGPEGEAAKRWESVVKAVLQPPQAGGEGE